MDKEIIKNLLNEVDNYNSNNLINTFTPVLYFGNISNAKIATIGINPSDKEYYDSKGKKYNRFYDKNFFKINSWEDLIDDDLEKIKSSYDNYFNNNPYKSWFNRLEFLFDDYSSYYFPISNSIHLDIIPVATKDKWGNLSIAEKNDLIKNFGKYLKLLISNSSIEICILNGKSVVENFQKIFQIDYETQKIESWNIINKNTVVNGIAYKTLLKGKKKNILVIGFNHNIQSSFGISSSITLAIKNWIKNEITKYYEK